MSTSSITSALAARRMHHNDFYEEPIANSNVRKKAGALLEAEGSKRKGARLENEVT